jgi:hypothetical protein
MAAQVVDELIVTLSLDAEPYQKVEAQVERSTDRTFRKQQDRARVTDRTNKDQQRRLKDVAAGVRSFGLQVAAAVGVVTGLGAAIGGTLSGFLSFETGLRRQAVGTALSNKQMQAWSATARRLGADASAGAEAIAALAKEQRQGVLTGNAPTLQALARMGVNIDTSRSLQDILGEAQNRYRAAPAGQRQQFEDALSAQGVSADLILMIKSERDVREAFTQSLSQATEENRKALDELADAFESIKATGVSVAGSLLEALKPAIEEGAVRLAEWAVQLGEFTKDLQDAGGGLQGFQEALDKNAPELGAVLRTLTDVLSVVVNRFRDTGTALRNLWSWITYYLNKVRAPWGSQGLADDIGQRVSNATGGRGILGAAADWWRQTVADNRARDIAEGRARLPRNIEDGFPNLNPHGLPRNIENDAPSSGMTGNAQDLMTKLITQYGLTAQQAAAVVANWSRESGLRSNALNPVGGGTGARGLAQWRGDRTKAFQARYGVLPDQASIDQQVEFAMTDPYERALMQRAFANSGDAQSLGRSYSQLYEAHGNVREDIRRGADAQRLAATYGGTAGASVSIQNMTVQTPDANALVGGLQRLGGSQSYNTVIR